MMKGQVHFAALLNIFSCLPYWGARGSYLQTIDPTTVYVLDQATTPSLLTWSSDLIFLNDTAVTFGWTLNIVNDFRPSLATLFEIEIAYGQHSEEFHFYALLVVPKIPSFSKNSYTTNYTSGSLLSNTYYRFRVIPIFESGRDFASAAITILTLTPAENYWELVQGRRLTLDQTGRGYAYPVLDRPHLSTGVENYAEGASDNLERFADPTTDETQTYPSGRRGGSLSSVEDAVLMFGGRTNGYSCASVFTDTINLGVDNSGRHIVPCSYSQGEVSEVWRLDINSYKWEFINTTKWFLMGGGGNDNNAPSDPPPPREQHSAAVVNAARNYNLYIYGGKARYYETLDDGSPQNNALHFDEIFGDFWKLSIQRSRYFPRLWGQGPLTIPQAQTVAIEMDLTQDTFYRGLSDGVTPRAGLCIQKIRVTVIITHSCINQLKIQLSGPGPNVGSPNRFNSAYGALTSLYVQDKSNGTGCAGGTHTVVFDDEAEMTMEEAAVTKHPFQQNRVYQPDGKLAEYIGTSMTSVWSLVLTDTKSDGSVPHLVNWGIDFTARACFNSYTWTNLTESIKTAETPIPARYGARSLVHGAFLFVFGGKDKNDQPLHDLHRYDTNAHTWVALRPSSFETITMDTATSTGASFMMSVWGMFRFGGVYRQPDLTKGPPNELLTLRGHRLCDYSWANDCMFPNGNAYDNSVYLLDPVTLKWKFVQANAYPAALGGELFFGSRRPMPRYLPSGTFISSSNLKWRTKYGHRALYDAPMKSTNANYQGSISDSILIIGGFDGSSGVSNDGSSGGYMNDMWMLRLSNLSTDGSRFTQQEYLDKRCKWRQAATATQQCISTSSSNSSSLTPGANATCDLKDLLMLVWCEQSNQTMI